MLLDSLLHHLPGRVLLGLVIVFVGCLALIWFPEEINDFTLGSWWRGYQITTPTPAFLVAGFGWICLITLSLVILIAFHEHHRR